MKPSKCTADLFLFVMGGIQLQFSKLNDTSMRVGARKDTAVYGKS